MIYIAEKIHNIYSCLFVLTPIVIVTSVHVEVNITNRKAVEYDDSRMLPKLLWVFKFLFAQFVRMKKTLYFFSVVEKIKI